MTGGASLPHGKTTMRRGWILTCRDGQHHIPLRENDEDAWWTPTACGGINLPGPQTRGEATCPICLNARADARRTA